MKTIVFVLIQVICFGAVYASNYNDTAYTTQIPVRIKNAIEEKIHYPQGAAVHKVEGVVAVCFSIDSTGKVIVKKINGHPDLIKDVTKQLAIMEFSKDMATKKDIIIRFRFDIK